MCRLLAGQLGRVMVTGENDRDLDKYVTSGHVCCYRDLPTVLNMLLIALIDIYMQYAMNESIFVSLSLVTTAKNGCQSKNPN